MPRIEPELATMKVAFEAPMVCAFLVRVKWSTKKLFASIFNSTQQLTTMSVFSLLIGRLDHRYECDHIGQFIGLWGTF